MRYKYLSLITIVFLSACSSFGSTPFAAKQQLQLTVAPELLEPPVPLEEITSETSKPN